MNKVIIMGRLTKKPVIETTGTGTLHTRFSVAVDRRFAKEGSQQTDFIQVVAWGKTAEFITMYFDKGVRIAIIGSLEVNTYQDKETMQNRTYTQVRAEEVYFADGKKGRNKKEEAGIDFIDSAFNIDNIDFN